MKVRSFKDIFQEISLQLRNNYMVTPVCRKPLDGCFSRSYSGIMPKKGITKKFVEVFTKDRNSSGKVTNKFKQFVVINSVFYNSTFIGPHKLG